MQQPLLSWAQRALPVAAGVVAGWAVYEMSKSFPALKEGYQPGAIMFRPDSFDMRSSFKKGVRTKPKDLSEQLTLEEAKAKPHEEENEIMEGKVKDPKYPAEEWKKAEHVHKRPDGKIIDIHYWINKLTGIKTGFKFKND